MHFERHVEGRQARQRNVSWEYPSASRHMPAPDRRQNLSVPRLPMHMIADTLALEREGAAQKDRRIEDRWHSRTDSSSQVPIFQFLVLASEISGLERLHALVKVDNLVVPFSFPYLAPLKSKPGFIPRAGAPRVVEIERCAAEPARVPD